VPAVIAGRYTPADAGDWDQFVAEAPTATFLHTRRFLEHHPPRRFRDASLLISEEHGRLVAVVPAACTPVDPGDVVSHPGATYGGFLMHAGVGGNAAMAAVEAAATAWREMGFGRLVYNAVPGIYHQRPFADDIWALRMLGAVQTRFDLTSAIDLAGTQVVSQRRRRALRKAERSGVAIDRCTAALPEFWPVLEEVLRTRHETAPVHSLEEISRLADLFPDEIDLVVARLEGEVVAGVVLFGSPRVIHAQYLASSPTGRAVGGLDAAVEAAIERARDLGRRFFDFGTSAEPASGLLNEGLYGWKQEFGAGSAPHERYELRLAA
jgi:hypothetical protein